MPNTNYFVKHLLQQNKGACSGPKTKQAGQTALSACQPCQPACLDGLPALFCSRYKRLLFKEFLQLVMFCTNITNINNKIGCMNHESKVAGDKGISEMKSKQQSPCSNCMHRPVTSWDNACSTCMHRPVMFMHCPVMSQADACSYCMGSVVLISSQIYLYCSYFA